MHLRMTCGTGLTLQLEKHRDTNGACNRPERMRWLPGLRDELQVLEHLG